MNTTKRTTCLLLLGGMALTELTACETIPAQNKGISTTADPAKRYPGEDELSSKDLINATDEMLESIATHPEFQGLEYRVQIVMDEVVNKTSRPNKDFEIYLARLRSNLNQSGLRYNIGFVENKVDVEAMRLREGLDPEGSTTYISKADYALRGEFYDDRKSRSNYYLLAFQIVDLHDGQIVWENDYEVKFLN